MNRQKYREQIIKLCQEGFTISEIAEKMNRKYDTIHCSLRRWGIKARRALSGYRKYTFDESYFDKIDIEDKAYFLGLFCADGCNQSSRFNITLIKYDKLPFYAKYFFSNLENIGDGISLYYFWDIKFLR